MSTAILFDATSIQQYVFGSNKLKDNLGASYIVEHIYDYLIGRSVDNPDDLEIGYVGGGNALVFTSSIIKAKSIVKEFTTKLLYGHPGVSLAVAIKDNFITAEEKYLNEIEELFKILAINKGKNLPVNTISSHGITDTCRFSSLSVEVIERYSDKTIDLISSSTASKRIFEGTARYEEKSLLNDTLLANYTFPDEFDNLGQKKGEDSHIAVVHIDGNGFGEVFRKLNSVDDTKTLSKKVRDVVKESFIYALKTYVSNEVFFKSIIDDKNYLNNILPIRPIVLGGDDVTFVCHGKLGIWFAEKFIEKFNTYYLDEALINQFSACAGVAIVKTKYPFYRAYQIAEELCNSAKKNRKDCKSNGNWLDFQLAYSGLGNTLEEIRKLQYHNTDDEPLYDRPYCFEAGSSDISFTELKTKTATLMETLPKSKIKDLREMLTYDKESLNEFIEHLKHQHNGKDGFKENFFPDGNTEQLPDYPFFDMIELLELYPTNLLNEN